MRRVFWSTMLVCGFVLLVSSCATMSAQPLAPGEMRLISMDIKERLNLKPHAPFEVVIGFLSDGKPEIRNIYCYYSDAGPYFIKEIDITYGSPGTIKIYPVRDTTGPYSLRCGVVYLYNGKVQGSNTLSASIRISE